MTVRIGTLQPNYLTVDPITGQISALFSGVIKAFGVSLPADDPSNDLINAVQWVEQADGALVAFVKPTLHIVPHLSQVRTLTLAALADASQGDTAAAVSAQATPAGGGPNAVNIIDSNNKSDLIKNAALGGPYNRSLDWGSIQITAAANTTFLINHNLGTAPTFYMAAILGTNGYCYGVSGSNNQVGFRSSVALANTFVSWLAGIN